MELQTIDFLIGIGGGFVVCLLTLVCCFRPKKYDGDIEGWMV